MQHKYGMTLSALALSALLVGCVPAQPPAGGDAGGGAQGNGTQTTEQQTAPVTNPFNVKDTEKNEPETVELSVLTETGVETVEAQVYKGGGYTIAVPKDWIRDDNEPEWSPSKKSDAELTIRFYPEKKADAVAKLFIASEDDYVYEEPAKTTLGDLQNVTKLQGSEVEDNGEIDELIAYFVETKTGTYGILLECPSSEAEGYGGYLGAMANSFTLTETKK